MRTTAILAVALLGWLVGPFVFPQTAGGTGKPVTGLTPGDLKINTEIAAHRVASFFNDHDHPPGGCRFVSKQRGTCVVRLTGDDPMLLKAYVLKYDGQHYSTHLHRLKGAQ